MKIHYYEDTDSLYIELSTKKSSDSNEVGGGVVIDFDSEGNIVGIDVENASKKIDLNSLETIALPMKSAKLA